jgi:hypothetical protein
MRSLSALVSVSLLLASACSTSPAPEGSPSTAREPATASASPSTAASCEPLVADVPKDLVKRRLHIAQADSKPVPVGVIWSNKRSTRVVNVSAAPSDEAFGDGIQDEPTRRSVQGIEASETVTNGVSRVSWHQEGASSPCKFWAVVSQGLTASELESVLQSVRETQ